MQQCALVKELSKYSLVGFAKRNVQVLHGDWRAGRHVERVRQLDQVLRPAFTQVYHLPAQVALATYQDTLGITCIIISNTHQLLKKIAQCHTKLTY